MTTPAVLVPREDHAGIISKTPTHPYSLVEGSYSIYDLPTTLITWASARVNFKASSTDSETEHKMEVSTEKSKIMTNSINNISADINMKSQKLDGVTSFE